MLNIYKASAGSGKTHTLTADYINLTRKLDFYFANILAVTFTNKAAEEMKERIIINLSESNDNKDKRILSKILHNYGYFNISTIDSFVQKIIKSFSFELKIPTSYNLELDLDFVTQNLVEKLIQEAQNDIELQKWMEILAFHNISSLKKWDFKRELIDFTSNIYKENFNNILVNIQDDNLHGNLLKLADKCKKDIKTYVDYVHLEIRKGIEIIKNDSNLLNLGAYFDSVIKFFYNNLSPYPTLECNTRISYFLDRKHESKLEKYGNHLNQIDELIVLINNLLEYKSTNESIFYSSKNIISNLYNFNLILKVYDLLKDYRTDNNLLLISDLTVFLKNLLGDTRNNAPFLYEKIGTKLHHIMIDEFQDTSSFQWNNFRPLVENSMAEGNFNMIVGDVKQSIYRWRNGDWRLLGFRLKEEFQQLKEINLSANWRSQSNIILFNNSLFSALPAFLQKKFNNDYGNDSPYSDLITSLYYDVKQDFTAHTKQGGFVELNFSRLDKIDIYYNIAEKIDELLDFYQPGDIGILVKTNTEGQEIVQYLLDYQNSKNAKQYNIISNEALLLGNSTAIKVIITVLQFINNQEELFFAKQIAYYYQYIQNETNNSKIFEVNEIDDLKEFLPNNFLDELPNLTQLNLFYQVLQIISVFELNKIKEYWPYLRSFEELVNEYLLNNQSNLSDFLNYWDLKKEKVSLSINESKDSVNVMTIHKSKGLAFRVVIVPSISWNMSRDRDLLWIDTKDTEYREYSPYIPILTNKELLKTDFAKYYIEEKVYSYIDILNVLYVAFTRAKEEIYAFGKITKDNNGSAISDYIYKSLITKRIIEDERETDLSNYVDQSIFSFGKRNDKPLHKQNEEKNKFEIEKYNTFAWNENIKITSHNEDFIAESFEKRRNAIKEGIKMHSIFEKINFKEDIEACLENLLKMNRLSKEEFEEVKVKIENIFKNPMISDLFDKKWNIYNEKKILTKKNQIYIPDRILENKEMIIVVDYKFGAKRSEHKKQINFYKKLLSQIYKNKEIKGILLYIQNEEIIEM